MKNQEVIEHIVQWLKTYAKKNQMNGFIIGISGGIDSALTSTLCAKTGLPTLCLEMPIKQQEIQVERAQEHIKWLQRSHQNVNSHLIDLEAVFDAFSSTVGADMKDNQAQLPISLVEILISRPTLPIRPNPHAPAILLFFIKKLIIPSSKVVPLTITSSY